MQRIRQLHFLLAAHYFLAIFFHCFLEFFLGVYMLKETLFCYFWHLLQVHSET